MFKKENYSPYWRQFSQYIRFERAEGRCECLGICGRDHNGRCAAVNEGVGKMGKDGIWRTENEIENLNHDSGLHLYGADFNFIYTKVCLTVAHPDHADGICRCKEIYGFKCAKPLHVLALCNFCHLNLDRDSHNRHRRKNLQIHKDSGRGLFTF